RTRSTEPSTDDQRRSAPTVITMPDRHDHDGASRVITIGEMRTCAVRKFSRSGRISPARSHTDLDGLRPRRRGLCTSGVRSRWLAILALLPATGCAFGAFPGRIEDPPSDASTADSGTAIDAAIDDAAIADAAVADATAVMIDASTIHDGGALPAPDAAARDGGRGEDAAIDASTGVADAGPPDPCEGVGCPGEPCRDARCDAHSGECVLDEPRADGTACDDADACTRVDACRAGVCVGAMPIVCAPADACHEAGVCDAATGACSSEPLPCTTEVFVRVRDAAGAALASPVTVRAFVGTSAQPQGGLTDASGDIRLVLPAGAYRFRAQRDGLPFWSGATDHCSPPSCTFVEIRLPRATPDRVVSWDPLMDGAYDGHGAIRPANPHISRGGTYLENWAIERYGVSDAFISAGHTHLYPQAWDPPDAWGNPTVYENQHAFGTTLQGIYVRLDGGGPFDLVSIDYRTRADTDPEHVSAVPGADPTDVAIWISDALTVPTTSWRSHPTGKPFGRAMGFWATVFPTHFTNVVGVFVTTTGNVSIDNVVVRPR
ncbi:MAG: carboxypeptidase-like regulatory domain-containing protein, partial [Myxococcota bacterium]|nr:carboxypeptidase-like regulatory domain-containing protein [Myxococcota bacterium]